MKELTREAFDALLSRIATIEAERDAALAWKQAAVTDATRPPLVFVLGGLHIPVERYTEMRTALATTLARITTLEAALREVRSWVELGVARVRYATIYERLARIDAALRRRKP